MKHAMLTQRASLYRCERALGRFGLGLPAVIPDRRGVAGRRDRLGQWGAAEQCLLDDLAMEAMSLE